MKLTSPAKLTLSLDILGRRDDGYHLIDAEMVSLDFADTLEVEASDEIEVEVAGEDFAVADTLVARALEVVGKTAKVKITKVIPPGAGLGGGSSNAAAILRWAQGEDGLEVTREMAAGVGADVAFCLGGGRARVGGVGEVVEPLDFLEGAYTLLVPPFGCVTAEVYKAFDELGKFGELSEFGELSGASESGNEPARQSPKGAGRNDRNRNDRNDRNRNDRNDLEFAALAVYPELTFYYERLGEISGKTPRLAGSGSTWFVEGEYEGEGLIVAHAVNSH